MFEKEARKHAFEGWEKSQDPRVTATPILNKDKYLSFQKGAEFGYNKANEWHFVKDGEYPKDDNDVLVLLKDKTTQVDYYFPKTGWNISVNSDVIAWKEIVLPELKDY